MHFLEGLNGTIACVVLCALLFLDEAGLPIPVAPNEVLLLIAGILIESDAIPPWIFLPVALLAMAAGTAAGYSWARAVGQTGLCALAEKFGVEAAYERVRARLASTSATGIFVARMIPGVRPYVTLICGAAQVDVREFALGAAPALVLWEIIWIALGMVVGLPVAHYLGRFERFAVQGVLLVIIGLIAYLGLRRAGARVPVPTRWVPRHGAEALDAVIGGGIAASLIAGLLTIGRRIVGVRESAWIDFVVVAIAVVAYIVLTRHDHRITAPRAARTG